MGGFNPINGLFGYGTNAIFSALTKWMVDSAIGLFNAAILAVINTTTPSLHADWFQRPYHTMVAIAAVAAFPLLAGCAISAVVHGDPRRLAVAVGIHLPLAAVGTFVAMSLLDLIIRVTDFLCGQVWSDPTGDLLNLGKNFTGTKAAGAAMVAGLLIVAALTLWLELALRQAAIYGTALLLPLFLAGLLWPGSARYAKRAVETLVALVLSKLVIAAVLALGLSGINAASPGDLQPLVAGTALALFASLAPWVLLRLIPVVETAAAAHLEGVTRRGISATPVGGLMHQTPQLIADAMRRGAGPEGPSAAVAALTAVQSSLPAEDHGLDTSVRPLVPPEPRGESGYPPGPPISSAGGADGG